MDRTLLDRVRVGRRRVSGRAPARRRIVVPGAIAALATVSIIAGPGFLQTVELRSSPTPGASPATGPSQQPPAFKDSVFQELGLELAVPAYGTMRESAPEGARVLHWTDDRASFSIYHGSPTAAAVCDPECRRIDLPVFLPFSLERSLHALEDEISATAGTDGWTDAAGLHPRVEHERWLDVRNAARPGEQRRYVVASYLSGVIAVALSVPDDEPGRRLAATILAGIRPYPAELYKVGSLQTYVDNVRHYEIGVPDVWAEGDIDALGSRRFGGNHMIVSVGVDGGFVVCDPACREVAADTLAKIEAALAIGTGADVTRGDATLSGAPARSVLDRSSNASYRVFGIVQGTPVHLWFDLRDSNVGLDVIHEIVDSFDLALASPRQFRDGVLVGPGYEVPLPDGMRAGAPFKTSITVSTGDSRDRFWVCLWGGFSSSTIPCSVERATTLAELATIIPGGTSRREAVLDGEPAIVCETATYEPPARGLQWLAYILAVHDGTPYVIRLQNSERNRLYVTEILRDFRFTD